MRIMVPFAADFVLARLGTAYGKHGDGDSFTFPLCASGPTGALVGLALGVLVVAAVRSR